jgi:O-antigen/teichoic acid export membrane protein
VALKKNVLANYIGQGWSALMGLAFIPLYIKYLGIEVYGLIGVFTLLQSWLSLLDMGMTPTLSREMSRFTGGAVDSQYIRNLLRSIEIVGCAVALLISLGIWAASDWLAADWLRAENLPVSAVARAFSVMGLVTALRFVENIYRSCLVGLQKQVLLNLIQIVTSTLRGLGAVAILIWLSPTIEAFFIWQGLISLATVGLCAIVVYWGLSAAPQPVRFSLVTLQKIWPFASGMIGITLLSLLLTQVDKLMLSKLLSLKDFGYYTLAATIASILSVLIAPITQAFYPRFNELVASESQSQLTKLYHLSAQLVTVLIGSIAIVLIVFGKPLLALWTQDALLAERLAPLLSVLVLGNFLNCLMHIPYQMQLAHGWTSLAIKINSLSVVIIVPAIFWATSNFGAIGAGWVWVCLNLSYFVIGIHFMYQRLLTAEKWQWYLQDIVMPLVAGTSVAVLLKLGSSMLVPSLVSTVVILTISSCGVFLATLMAAPAVRLQFVGLVIKRS